jgi:hypothetical protein
VGLLVLGRVAEAEVAVAERDGALFPIGPHHLLGRLRRRRGPNRGGSGRLLVDGSVDGQERFLAVARVHHG